MDATEQLIANRLSWQIENAYFRDTDLEECRNKPHIKRRTAAEAQSRAEKIVGAYMAENPTRAQKRVLSDSRKIWERRFDETLDDAIDECMTDIEEHDMVEQVRYLRGADE